MRHYRNKKRQRLEAFVYHSQEGYKTTEEIMDEFRFRSYSRARKRLKHSQDLIWAEGDRWYHLDALRLEDLAELVWSRAIKRPTRRRAIRRLHDLARRLQQQEE